MILGANGAGKASLLCAIQGMVAPSRGEVLLAGADVSPPRMRPRGSSALVWCFVPEGRQIFVSLTVHDNLLMGAYTRRTTRSGEDIEAVYDRFPNLAKHRDNRGERAFGEGSSRCSPLAARCCRALAS